MVVNTLAKAHPFLEEAGSYENPMEALSAFNAISPILFFLM